MKKLEMNPLLAKMTWPKFKAYHAKRFATKDPLTAEERFVKIGGKLPKEK